jgi:hypothetical protein
MGERAFSDAARIVAQNGSFLATFHHPSLVDIATRSLPDLQKKLSSKHSSYVHAKSHHSSKTPQLLAALLAAQRELRDAEFIVKSLSQVLFKSKADIEHVMHNHFPRRTVRVSEHQGETSENGWYFVSVTADNQCI